jgi:inorganic pyrophosphatase
MSVIEDKPVFTRATDYLGKIVAVTVDRPLHSPHPKFHSLYELNYGFVPDTKSPDGEELDAYIIGIDTPVTRFEGRCVAVIHRTNDDDDKLVVAPLGYRPTVEEIRVATHFQEQFFESEIILAHKID